MNILHVVEYKENKNVMQTEISQFNELLIKTNKKLNAALFRKLMKVSRMAKVSS